MEQGLTKHQIITELTRSPHGKLEEYTPVAARVAREDPEFLAHLIAWNQKNGAMRDSKVALPVLALAYPTLGFNNNARAHLLLQGPRELVRAWRFGKTARVAARELNRDVALYLRAREKDQGWWTHTAISHRQSMKELYALAHIKPNQLANDVLFAGKKIGVFKEIAELKDMDPAQAAAVVLHRRIPFLVAVSAMGAKAKSSFFLLALIESMSPTELVTNTKMLDRLGVLKDPALRAAFEAGLARVTESKKQVLKTTVAAKQVTDAKIKAKLEAAQEKQLDKMEVDGDWLVLADKSGSMEHAIEAACHIASILARAGKGKVVLCFFDTQPRAIEVTGLSFEEIAGLSKHVKAAGGTSIGVGVKWALEYKHSFDGIAIVSDGGENERPRFADAFAEYTKFLGKEIPVYLYLIDGGGGVNRSFGKANDCQVFELSKGVDYHSLPNLVQTMRSNRFSLVDEIMATPLLTVEQALTRQGG